MPGNCATRPKLSAGSVMSLRGVNAICVDNVLGVEL